MLEGIRELVQKERWFGLPHNVHDGPRPRRTGNCFTRTTPDEGMQMEEKVVWYKENVPSRVVLYYKTRKRQIPETQLPMDVAPGHKLGLSSQPLCRPFRTPARPRPSFE